MYSTVFFRGRGRAIGPKFIFHIKPWVGWYWMDMSVACICSGDVRLKLFIINDERLSNTYFRIICLLRTHFSHRCYTLATGNFNQHVFSYTHAHCCTSRETTWENIFTCLKSGLNLYSRLEKDEEKCTRKITDNIKQKSPQYARTSHTIFDAMRLDDGILYIVVYVAWNGVGNEVLVCFINHLIYVQAYI